MKRLMLLLGLILIFGVVLGQTKYKVATYNFRYKNTTDVGNLWDSRKGYVVDIIQRYGFDVFGVQEAYAVQLNDVKLGLTNFNWSGKDRDNTGSSEYTAIFYNTAKFNLLTSGHFWLSPTPTVAAPGWDALYARICSWVKLQDKVSGYTFFVFNSHFDHQGSIARTESVNLIGEKIVEIAGTIPTIFCGDLNFTQNDANYTSINALGLLKDTYYLAAASKNIAGTLNSFTVDAKTNNRIDHIFSTNNIKVYAHDIITDSYSGKMPSDHHPVMIEIGAKITESGELYWQFPEDFETGTKADNYNTADVNLKTGLWSFVNTLLPSQRTSDKPSSGVTALRMNDNNAQSYIEMKFDLTEGISKVTVQHSVWDDNTTSKWGVYYSRNGGLSWHRMGDYMYTNQLEKRLAIFYADIPGNVRLRIYRFGGAPGTKLSLDDIAVYKRKNTTATQAMNNTIVAWNMDNPTTLGNETELNSNIAHSGLQISKLSRGSGLTPVAFAKGFASRASVASVTATVDTTIAVNNNLYYEFSLAVKPGHKASLNTINANLFINNDGGAGLWYWKYSTDGVTYNALKRPYFASPTVGAALPTVDLTHISSLQDISAGNKVYFRLYQIGATAATDISAFSSANLELIHNNALAVEGLVENIATPNVLLSGWSFYENAGSESTVAANNVFSTVSVTPLARANAIEASKATLANAFVTLAPVVTGANIVDTTAAINNNLYFYFSIKPQTGKLLNLSRLSHKIRTSSGGAKYWHWKYSFDNTIFHTLAVPFYANTINDNGRQMEDIDLSLFPQLQNLDDSKTVYFRVYFNGSNATTGSTALGKSASLTDYALAIYGSSQTVTPVNLISFKGKAVGRSNALLWQTASEQNNSHFDVQRLGSDQNFETIGRVAASKNVGVNNYQLSDNSPVNGVNYYRLRQVDLNNSQNLSEVISISNSFAQTQLAGFFLQNGWLKIDAKLPLQSKAELIIADVLGKQLYKQNVTLFNGTLAKEIDGSKWEKGLYIISLNAGSVIKTTKIIK